MTNPELESLLQKIRELFAVEITRAEKNAIARIVQAARGEPITDGHATTEPSPSRGRKERAPTGAPKALIDRVLSECGAKGASPTEIKSAAKGHAERLVSFAAVRFALVRGREGGQYRNSKGRWFLKVKKETAGTSANP